jgi:hypothetical protein
MGRRRKSNHDLPPLMHLVGDRYYFKASSRAMRDAVGAWTFPLGGDLTIARGKWAELLAKASLLRVVHHRKQLERPEKPDTTPRGFIYAMRAGEAGPVKIGFTTNQDTLRARVRDLQPGSADRLCILGIAVGSVRQEKLCHRALAEFRLEGEWFRPDPRTLVFVNRLVRQGVRAALLDNCNFPADLPASVEMQPENSATGLNKAVVKA